VEKTEKEVLFVFGFLWFSYGGMHSKDDIMDIAEYRIRLGQVSKDG